MRKADRNRNETDSWQEILGGKTGERTRRRAASTTSNCHWGRDATWRNHMLIYVDRFNVIVLALPEFLQHWNSEPARWKKKHTRKIHGLIRLFQLNFGPALWLCFSFFQKLAKYQQSSPEKNTHQLSKFHYVGSRIDHVLFSIFSMWIWPRGEKREKFFIRRSPWCNVFRWHFNLQFFPKQISVPAIIREPLSD